METTQTVYTTVGYWALGAVVIYLAASTVFRMAFVAGDFIHDLSVEVQQMFGRVVFISFAVALCYLAIWGCYLIGELVFTSLASIL